MQIAHNRTPASTDAVMAAAERQSWRSSSNIAQPERPQPSALQILRDDRAHPTHYSRSACLFPHNLILRMKFCERIKAADDLPLHDSLWTNEACSTRKDVFHVRKSHLWARAIFIPSVNVSVKSASTSTFGFVSGRGGGLIWLRVGTSSGLFWMW